VLERGRNARTGAAESQISVILAEGAEAMARPKPSPTPLVDERRVRQAVQRAYARVALFPERPFPLPVGYDHALALGYPSPGLASLPRDAVVSYCGIACPLPFVAPKPGATVVDVGCGSGVDAMLLAQRVGERGQVVGIELTEELLRKAQVLGRHARSRNLRFERGLAEDLPLPAESADLVLANGVVNLLVDDKVRALAEAWRVLRPGGQLVLADVVVAQAAPREERAIPERWAQGLAGPVPEVELLDLIGQAGFAERTVVERDDARGLDGPKRIVVVARKVGQSEGDGIAPV
jgi:SAM-dependent methyltransferase